MASHAAPSRPTNASAKASTSSIDISALPSDLLEKLLSLFSGEEGGAQNIRLTCKSLRNVFDAWNTRLVLGASFIPNNSSAKERRALRARESSLKGIISRTPRLNSLVLKRWSCSKDTQLPFPWWQIKHVEIMESGRSANHPSLDDLSFLDKCGVLEHLNLEGRSEFNGLPESLEACSSTLKRLVVGECDSKDSEVRYSHLLGLIPTFTALEELELHEVDILPDFALIANGCSLLHSLTITIDTLDLMPLASLSRLTSLKLFIEEESEDSTWDPLSACTSLVHLSLANNGVKTVRALSSLTALTYLDLSYSTDLRLDPLLSCIALQHLVLEECDQLHSLAPLSSFTALRRLELSGCQLDRALVFPALLPCSLLEHLDLNCCEDIIGEDVQPLSIFQHLRYLDLGHSSRLWDLEHLSSLLELRTLNLSWSDSLQDISPLHLLTNLRQLYICSCPLLTDLTPLSALASLRKLDLSGNDQQDGGLDVRPLSALVGLIELDLSDSILSRNMTVFSTLTNLKYLGLSRTRFLGKIKDLAPLGHCVSLQYLDLRIRGGRLDHSLEPLAKCTKLRVLHIELPSAMSLAPCFECLDPLSSTLWLKVEVQFGRLNSFESQGVSWDTGVKAWVMHTGTLTGPFWGAEHRYNTTDDLS